MIDFVESGIGLSFARKSVLNRRDRKRNFVIADACDYVRSQSGCLKSRRREPVVVALFRRWNGHGSMVSRPATLRRRTVIEHPSKPLRQRRRVCSTQESE